MRTTHLLLIEEKKIEYPHRSQVLTASYDPCSKLDLSVKGCHPL